MSTRKRWGTDRTPHKKKRDNPAPRLSQPTKQMATLSDSAINLSMFWICDGVTWLVRLLLRGLPLTSSCCQFHIEVEFKALDITWTSKNRWIKKWQKISLLRLCSCFFNNSPRQWQPEANRFLFLDLFLLCESRSRLELWWRRSPASSLSFDAWR